MACYSDEFWSSSEMQNARPLRPRRWVQIASEEADAAYKDW